MRTPGPPPTRSALAIIEALGATKRPRGVDAVDKDGVIFEIRESTKSSALFRLQRDVHLELCRSGGYYIFKKGSKFVKINANEVTDLIKDKKWSSDRTYPYKHLRIAHL